MKLGAAPEIDRHTLQLAQSVSPAATMAVSLRVTNSHGRLDTAAVSRGGTPAHLLREGGVENLSVGPLVVGREKKRTLAPNIAHLEP